MRLKSRSPRSTVVGLVGTGTAGAWRVYSAVTTAEQVPQDLRSVSHLLADPGFWPWLFIVGFLFLLGWSLWPTHEEPKPESGGATIRTGGPNSPAIGSVSGNVTQVFHAAPIVTNPRKEAGGYRLTSKSLARLERVMRGDRERSTGSRMLHRIGEKLDATCPELPIWKAIEYVRKIIGDDDSSNSYPEARRRIRQAALEGRLVLWGRLEIPPQHLGSELMGRSVWSSIEPDYWQEYEINRLATVERFDDKEHTQNEAATWKIGDRYWSLRVRDGAVKRLWPEPLRTTNDDDDRTDWKTV